MRNSEEKAGQYVAPRIEIIEVPDAVATSGAFEGGDHEFPIPTLFEL